MIMKILTKLLVVKGQLQAANDYQAMLMDKPLAIVEEIIEEVTKEVTEEDKERIRNPYH